MFVLSLLIRLVLIWYCFVLMSGFLWLVLRGNGLYVMFVVMLVEWMGDYMCSKYIFYKELFIIFVVKFGVFYGDWRESNCGMSGKC